MPSEELSRAGECGLSIVLSGQESFEPARDRDAGEPERGRQSRPCHTPTRSDGSLLSGQEPFEPVRDREAAEPVRGRQSRPLEPDRDTDAEQARDRTPKPGGEAQAQGPKAAPRSCEAEAGRLSPPGGGQGDCAPGQSSKDSSKGKLVGPREAPISDFSRRMALAFCNEFCRLLDQARISTSPRCTAETRLAPIAEPRRLARCSRDLRSSRR
mmetsp:Transcript_134670/g.430154  ORF Transcript_134670/g.430154 Transcript_134670/m.430154 type:complete len:212 (+) Transcript_134670:165-800(+)